MSLKKSSDGILGRTTLNGSLLLVRAKITHDALDLRRVTGYELESCLKKKLIQPVDDAQYSGYD